MLRHDDALQDDRANTIIRIDPVKTMGGDLGGTGGDNPPKFEVEDGPCIRIPYPQYFEKYCYWM